jgi:hypothetical protein
MKNVSKKFRDALIVEAVKKKKITDDQEIFDAALRIEKNIKQQVLLECSENIESETMTIVIKV